MPPGGSSRPDSKALHPRIRQRKLRDPRRKLRLRKSRRLWRPRRRKRCLPQSRRRHRPSPRIKVPVRLHRQQRIRGACERCADPGPLPDDRNWHRRRRMPRRHLKGTNKRNRFYLQQKKQLESLPRSNCSAAFFTAKRRDGLQDDGNVINCKKRVYATGGSAVSRQTVWPFCESRWGSHFR